MSYQALARKYRPKSFSEIAGQQHALNSLMHALEIQKVHHAYLFTGTRGVGKTTFGRLLAKALNCKTGVTTRPCNRCENCTAINNNSFIDLIEIDAASRTGVEDTKEILDNIQYMPSQGKYKIYLIDEVHMLSKQSFNALLKTLEEPPAHVKFILATTDYHKIPVTILSRCIQIHLKHISTVDIKSHLKIVLSHEKVTYDEQSLDYIAYHAKGSLRDSLSLLDQAISFCNGELKQSQIKQMLGIIDSEEIYNVIEAIINNSPNSILPAIKNLALTENSAEAVLDKIAEIWFSCCVYNLTNSIDSINNVSVEIINKILNKITIEKAHFLYQLTISAKKDIFLAPNFETGVTMAILRLVAFQKKDLGDDKQLSHSNPKITNNTKNDITQLKQNPSSSIKNNNHPQVTKNSIQPLDEIWFELLSKIKLKGLIRTLAVNSHLINKSTSAYEINLNDDAKKILELDPQVIAKLQANISQHLNDPNFQLSITNLSNAVIKNQKSPAEIKRKNAIQKIHNDPNINIIKEKLKIDIKDKNIILTD